MTSNSQTGQENEQNGGHQNHRLGTKRGAIINAYLGEVWRFLTEQK